MKRDEAGAIIEKNQESLPGLQVSSNVIEHTNDDKLDWFEYQKDIQKIEYGNPIVSTTIKSLLQPLQSKYELTPGQNNDEAKEMVDYTYWWLDNLDKGFDYFHRHFLRAITRGLSLFEPIVQKGAEYKFIQNGVGKKKITNCIIALSPIQNHTIKQFYYNPNTGKFEGIQHERLYIQDNPYSKANNKDMFVDIPIWDSKGQIPRLFWWTFEEYDNDIRGNGVIRPVRYYVDAEKKLLTGVVNNIIRGTGLPGIETQGEPANATQLDTIGRNLASTSQAYYRVDVTKAKIILNDLKGQDQALGILQFINRELFFNTSSQFMTSGLGENGSRAATGELKSTYELAVNAIDYQRTCKLQELVNMGIQLSYLSGGMPDNYPVISFPSVTQLDRQQEAAILKDLRAAGLVITDKEWNTIIRPRFNMPVIEEVQEVKTLPDETNIDNKYSKKVQRKQKSYELEEFERNTFEKESANNHFLSAQEQATKIIDDMTVRLLTDIAKQLEGDHTKEIQLRFEGETVNKLNKIYNEVRAGGIADVQKELAKVGKKGLQLTKTFTDKEVKNNLSRLVKKYFFDIKIGVENKLAKMTDEQVADKGLLEIVFGFKDVNKGTRYDIVNETQNGYTNGRGEELEANKDNIELYLLTATLDEALCTICGEMDGFLGTVEEFSALGISVFQAPHNTNCEGGHRDRCQVMPFSLVKKEDLE